MCQRERRCGIVEWAYQGHVIQTMPRLVGKKVVAINYRHIIDSLVRKPGAFANYQYRVSEP